MKTHVTKNKNAPISSNPTHCDLEKGTSHFLVTAKDECSYDVHKFKYSSQKKFLIYPYLIASKCETFCQL